MQKNAQRFIDAKYLRLDKLCSTERAQKALMKNDTYTIKYVHSANGNGLDQMCHNSQTKVVLEGQFMETEFQTTEIINN